MALKAPTTNQSEASDTPTNATPPIAYTWSPTPTNGQGTPGAAYRWTTSGTHTVTVRAENCGGPLTATQRVWLAETDQPVIYLPLVLRQ